MARAVTKELEKKQEAPKPTLNAEEVRRVINEFIGALDTAWKEGRKPPKHTFDELAKIALARRAQEGGVAKEVETKKEAAPRMQVKPKVREIMEPEAVEAIMDLVEIIKSENLDGKEWSATKGPAKKRG